MSDLEMIYRRHDAEKAEITGKLFDALNEIERLRAELEITKVSAKKWEDAFEIQREQLVNAREALRPFERFSDWDERLDYQMTGLRITYGELRKAQAVLKTFIDDQRGR